MTPRFCALIVNMFAALRGLPARLANAEANRSFRGGLLLEAALEGNIHDLSALLIEPTSRKFRQTALCAAAENGHAECLKMLIPAANPKAYGSAALDWAAGNGHAECLKLLIPVCRPKNRDSAPLRWAAENGHAECVKLLIPDSEPKARSSRALRKAAQHGHPECVRLLIPASDPKARDSRALYLAAHHGHAECVKLLAPVSELAFENLDAVLRAAGDDDGCVELLILMKEKLIQCEGALSKVFKFGCAKVAAAMLDSDPRLLESLDLPQALSKATSAGHAQLAGLLSSIIDRQALSATLASTDVAPSRPSRL